MAKLDFNRVLQVMLGVLSMGLVSVLALVSYSGLRPII
jgi:hypothetical protein